MTIRDTNSWKVVYNIPGETECIAMTTEIMFFKKLLDNGKYDIGVLNFTHNLACEPVPTHKIKVMPITYFTQPKLVN